MLAHARLIYDQLPALDETLKAFIAVPSAQALDEELFLGLRQLDGISLKRIETVYSTDLHGKIASLQAAGLVERQGDVVKLARGKISISNEVFVQLLS